MQQQLQQLRSICVIVLGKWGAGIVTSLQTTLGIAAATILIPKEDFLEGVLNAVTVVGII